MLEYGDTVQFLGSKMKSAISAVAIGIVSFGIMTAAIVATSAQAAPPIAIANSAEPDSGPVEELEIGAVVEVRSAQDISFPIDAYRPVPDEQNFIDLAVHEAMQSCMARFGLKFDRPFSKVPMENHDYDRLFGVLNLAEATTDGYHIPGEVVLASGEAARSEKDPPSADELDPLFLNVASGDGDASVNGKTVPEGGCITEARSKLGNVDASQTLYETAVNYGLTQSDRDTRVIAAFRSWSACMKDRGFTYETPMAAVDDPHWATPTASEAEIEVATADIQCKTSTNLTGLRVAVASAWQSQYIASHAKEYAAAREGVEEQLASARSLLQSSQ